jgi:Tfp pilus assembly protein PilZ
MIQSGNGSNPKKMTVSEATSKLISMILKMSPNEIMDVLRIIEEKDHEKKRRSPRVNYFMAVDYVVGDRAYSGYINNISSEGVFIETNDNLPLNGDITLTFALPNSQGHIRVSGKIVRKEKNGIGIAFDLDIQSVLERKRTKTSEATNGKAVV